MSVAVGQLAVVLAGTKGSGGRSMRHERDGAVACLPSALAPLHAMPCCAAARWCTLPAPLFHV